MSRVALVPIEPTGPGLVLVPFIHERLGQGANGLMTQVFAGNPGVRVLGLVDTEHQKLVGHAVAVLNGRDVLVNECRMDAGNWGDARDQVLIHFSLWAAKASGGSAQRMLWAAPRYDKALVKRWGFKTQNIILEKPLGGAKDVTPHGADG